MTDTVDYDDDSVDETPEATSERKNWRRDLEAKAKAGEAATKEAAEARRELSFLKAGVDTESALGKMFAKGYDGETSLDAIKAAWSELGGGKSEQVPDVSAEELAAHSRMNSAAAGSENATQNDEAYAAVTAVDWQTPGGADAVLKAFVAAGGQITDETPGRWLN